MNIYESMNKSFEAAMEKRASKKLTESVEKPVVEFKEFAIPAPFADYYRIIRPEEYEDVLGFEYDEAEMKRDAAEQYGIESFQYAILKDKFDTDGECKIIAVCKDRDVVYVAINVGGEMFPVDFSEVKEEIKEVRKPAEEHADESAESVEEEPIKESLTEQEDFWKATFRHPTGLRDQVIAKGGDADAVEYALRADYHPQSWSIKPISKGEFESLLKKGLSELKVTSRAYAVDGDDIRELIDDEIPEDIKRAMAGLDEPLVECDEKQKVITEAVTPWEKLVKAYPELAEEPIKESVEKDDEEEADLWDKIYGEITMDGETVPSSTGKSYKFNTGAGYDFNKVWTLPDGCGVKVGATSLEELKAAADIAEKYADKGVTYELRRGHKHRDRLPFVIEIHIPEELC